MKITFVTSHLTFLGGVGKFILDYANEFYEKSHLVVIVAQKIDRNNYKFDNRISLIEIGGPIPSNLLYWLRLNKIKKKYLNVLNSLDSDVIFSHLFPANYFCSNIKYNRSFKHIYYCHEPFRYFHDKKFYSNAPFSLKFKSFILRIFFKKYDIEGTLAADEIICNSIFTKNKVKEIYGKESSLLYPVLDMDDLENLNDFNLKQILKLKKNTSIIFTLGLTHHMKGVKDLLCIFNKYLCHNN